MTRIQLIDDDVKVIAHLGAYLEQEGFSVHIENEAARGVTEALSGNYGIAVLDLMMTRPNALEALQRIRDQSTVPVLMLTQGGDDADRITGLELGADDYVDKPCTPHELVARIRAILRRIRPFAAHDPAVDALKSGSLLMWPGQRRAEWLGEPLALTSTEFSLLEVLLRHVGHPVSKADLSQHALGRPHARHDRSVDMHLSNSAQARGLSRWTAPDSVGASPGIPASQGIECKFASISFIVRLTGR
jgi:two-component system, OmpR family, response regulator